MLYKVVLLGSCGVGKSALAVRFIQNRFVEDYQPTIRNVYRRYLVVDGERCHMSIVDTAGAEAFQGLRDDCIRWGHGFLIVYTVDYIKTFEDVNLFWEQLQRVKGPGRVPVVLVANKVDLTHWLVDTDLGQEAARSFGVPYVETSAKTRQGVVKAFRELIVEMRAGGQIPVVQRPLFQEPQDHPQPEPDQHHRSRRCTIL